MREKVLIRERSGAGKKQRLMIGTVDFEEIEREREKKGRYGIVAGVRKREGKCYEGESRGQREKWEKGGTLKRRVGFFGLAFNLNNGRRSVGFWVLVPTSKGSKNSPINSAAILIQPEITGRKSLEFPLFFHQSGSGTRPTKIPLVHPQVSCSASSLRFVLWFYVV